MRREIQAQEKRLLQREEHLDRKVLSLDGREEELTQRERALPQMEEKIRQREKESEALVTQQAEKLEKISGMTAEEAKTMLIAGMESEARHDAAKRIKQIEDEARETADKKSYNFV